MRRGAVLLILSGAALLAGACSPGQGTACPAIAAAPVVSLSVSRDYAPQVQSLHMTACQEGDCTEGPVELQPGSTSVHESCHPRTGPDSVCSATASPDGTLQGMLMLERLTEAPVAITVTGVGTDGLVLPVRTHTINPVVSTPFGEGCGRFVSAAATLDASGLSSRLPEP